MNLTDCDCGDCGCGHIEICEQDSCNCCDC